MSDIPKINRDQPPIFPVNPERDDEMTILPINSDRPVTLPERARATWEEIVPEDSVDKTAKANLRRRNDPANPTLVHARAAESTDHTEAPHGKVIPGTTDAKVIKDKQNMWFSNNSMVNLLMFINKNRELMSKCLTLQNELSILSSERMFDSAKASAKTKKEKGHLQGMLQIAGIIGAAASLGGAAYSMAGTAWSARDGALGTGATAEIRNEVNIKGADGLPLNQFKPEFAQQGTGANVPKILPDPKIGGSIITRTFEGGVQMKDGPPVPGSTEYLKIAANSQVQETLTHRSEPTKIVPGMPADQKASFEARNAKITALKEIETRASQAENTAATTRQGVQSFIAAGGEIIKGGFGVDAHTKIGLAEEDEVMFQFSSQMAEKLSRQALDAESKLKDELAAAQNMLKEALQAQNRAQHPA